MSGGLGTMRAVFRLPLLLGLGLGLALGAPPPADAQINPFRGSFANRLSNDDFKALGDAASSLLSRDPLPVGATEPWQNAGTGSHGTIKVTRTFRHAGDVCHALDYTVMPGRAGGRSTSHATLNWCKTASGWKIL